MDQDFRMLLFIYWGQYDFREGNGNMNIEMNREHMANHSSVCEMHNDTYI